MEIINAAMEHLNVVYEFICEGTHIVDNTGKEQIEFALP